MMRGNHKNNRANPLGVQYLEATAAELHAQKFAHQQVPNNLKTFENAERSGDFRNSAHWGRNGLPIHSNVALLCQKARPRYGSVAV